MSDWLPPLLTKLDRLRAADPAFLVTGAREHRYCSGPKASEAWLKYAETEYGIRLPEQFRQYLFEVGNGGCGPWYGLQRFGYLPNSNLVPTAIWTGESGTIETAWNYTRTEPVEFLSDGSPTDGFEVRFFDAMRALAGGETILAEPFPFTEQEVPEEEMESRLRFQRDRWLVPGGWQLAHYGCGIEEVLVLNGPRLGEVWSFDFGNGTGARHLFNTFAEWYDAWLDHSLAHCEKSFNYRRIKSLFATKSWPLAGELLARLQAAGIRSELGDHPRSGTATVLVGNEGEAEARRIIAEFETEHPNRD